MASLFLRPSSGRLPLYHLPTSSQWEVRKVYFTHAFIGGPNPIGHYRYLWCPTSPHMEGSGARLDFFVEYRSSRPFLFSLLSSEHSLRKDSHTCPVLIVVQHASHDAVRRDASYALFKRSSFFCPLPTFEEGVRVLRPLIPFGIRSLPGARLFFARRWCVSGSSRNALPQPRSPRLRAWCSLPSASIVSLLRGEVLLSWP